MTSRELKKLTRQDLLEILVEQQKQIDALEQTLHEIQSKQKEQLLEVQQAGSIAEASLRVSRVFEAAQHAVQIYQTNVRKRAEDEAQAIVGQAQQQAQTMIQQARQRCAGMGAAASEQIANLPPKEQEAMV